MQAAYNLAKLSMVEAMPGYIMAMPCCIYNITTSWFYSFFSPCLLLCYIDLPSVEMDENDLEMLRPIGKGQFGKVFKGLWKGMQVAIKEVPKGYGKPDLTEIDICR